MRLPCLVWLLFAPGLSTAQTAEQKKATIDYLQGLRQADGGFSAEADKGRKAQSSLRATSSALRALKYFGSEVKDKEAAAKFIKSCFDAQTGGFGDTLEGKPSVALTAIGLMAAVEAQMPLQPFAKKATEFMVKNAKDFEDYRIAAAGFEAIKTFPPEFKNWMNEVEKQRNPDGSFGKNDGKARFTGGAVAFILRSGGTLSDADRKGALRAIREGQRADGGFGKEGSQNSDLETTYRVMRALQLLKESPTDVERLRSFLKQCRNKDGGYGIEPGKPSSVGGTYFAGIILYWLSK
jgi:hypothetical protein